MTYQSSYIQTTALKIDAWRQNDQVSFSPYDRISWNTVGALDTGATLETGTNSTKIVLPAGSSWYLEASIGALNSSRNTVAELQFYDLLSSAFVGQSAQLCIDTSHGSALRQGRRVARALILDSDITTQAEICLAIKSVTGSPTWSVTSVGINGFLTSGVPTLRIWELPS